jgi:hypothetical protein
VNAIPVLFACALVAGVSLCLLQLATVALQ